MATPLVLSATRVLTSEPAVLATIVSFVPVLVADAQTTSTVTAATSTTTGNVATAARSVVASLCRAIPGLSRLVGPNNKSFWRAMVLTHFDFTEDPAKACNIKDHDSSTRSCSLWYMRYETISESQSQLQPQSDCSRPCPQVWDEHPLKPLVDGWEAAHPEQPTKRQRRSGDSPHAEFLHRKLHWWSALRAYYRPHEYQFLTDIQRGTARVEAAWPDHEDAFTLLGDLILLQQLVQRDDRHIQMSSDCENRVDPLFMGRFQLGESAYEMLAFCDILPHYWSSSDLRVSARWSGFSGALPVVENPKRRKPWWSRNHDEDVWEEVDEKDEATDDDLGAARTKEEARIFPISRYISTFQRLRVCVYKSFTDWRRVDVHFQESGSPEFYIGASKLSGRWLGYVGSSQFDPSPQVLERVSRGFGQCIVHGY